MKKLNKVAVLFASAALAAPIAAFAQAKSIDNWRASDGTAVEERHQRTLLARCQLDAGHRRRKLRRRPQARTRLRPPRRPRVRRPRPRRPLRPRSLRPRPPAPAAPAAPVSEKVTFAADAFFDFDKSVLKPEAKAKMDDLVSKTQGVNLEVIIAVGHTDSVGSGTYNQKLSMSRADAVKNYLVGKGIEKNRVYTEGKGDKQPVADNKTSEGRAKNRRVEIEVVGTRAKK